MVGAADGVASSAEQQTRNLRSCCTARLDRVSARCLLPMPCARLPGLLPGGLRGVVTTEARVGVAFYPHDGRSSGLCRTADCPGRLAFAPSPDVF
jgi:hypothetical protein